jgi:hypothetical protein
MEDKTVLSVLNSQKSKYTDSDVVRIMGWLQAEEIIKERELTVAEIKEFVQHYFSIRSIPERISTTLHSYNVTFSLNSTLDILAASQEEANKKAEELLQSDEYNPKGFAVEIWNDRSDK